MTAYSELQTRLVANPKTWLVTGVAEYIGSNLWGTLLKLNQRVVGLDNFSKGYQHNFYEVQSVVTTEQWANFQFFEDDIRCLTDCHKRQQHWWLSQYADCR
jgi:UDP-N-acetylglucosamine 4-epimerase